MADLMLGHRVAKVLPDAETLELLAQSKRLRVYIGIDPTATRLHLGHTIGLRKLMDFANAGHEAILLFGTGTVLVGDPSLRDTARKTISQEEIDRNIASWKQQVAPLVDFDKVTIMQNGEWLVPLTLKDIINISSHISATQLFKRESFTRRIARGDTVWYHETMYPLLQGYDSVVMDVDVEIGGTDQEFNMLMGRELQRKMNNREKYVVEVPMIVGTDGNQMSKSSGNCIWLDDSADEMFGKLMSAQDEQIVQYIELLSDISSDGLNKIKSDLSGGVNPRDAKLTMAKAVTGVWHGHEAAVIACNNWLEQFSNGNLPTDIDEFSIDKTRWQIDELLVVAMLAESKSDARRMVQQGAVKIDSDKLEVTTKMVSVADGQVLQVGKRRFVRLKHISN